MGLFKKIFGLGKIERFDFIEKNIYRIVQIKEYKKLSRFALQKYYNGKWNDLDKEGKIGYSEERGWEVCGERKIYKDLEEARKWKEYFENYFYEEIEIL